MEATGNDMKQARFKQFLQRLSEETEAHGHIAKPERTISELLLFAGMMPNCEAVDMSRLVTRLLHMQGVEACSEQMIEHVLRGGTVENFLRQSLSSE